MAFPDADNPFGADGLNLSHRVQNVLRANGVMTVEAARALGYGGLRKLFRMGERGAREAWEALAPGTKTSEPVARGEPSSALLASLGYSCVVTLRVASPLPADRIVDVLLSDSKGNVRRTHLLSVTEDVAGAVASGVALQPMEDQPPT